MTYPTGPLPTVAPLADFASPTIEVQHTPPDDHPLDDVTPAHDPRLLTAYERIGYLTAQLEYWQAEAERLAMQVEVERSLSKQRWMHELSKQTPPPEGDPDLVGPPAPEPRKHRWFPFNW